MKRRWLQFAARVEALQPRERIMVFGATVVVLVFLVNALVLGPLARKEAALRSTLQQQEATIDGVNAEIAAKANAYADDPNEALRKGLADVRAESARTSDDLRAMQKGLVPPERIAPLLESILRANGRLKLVSLQTLPVTTLGEDAAAAGAAPVAAPVAKTSGLLYRHGVELTVRGSYLDMVDYMQALETLPTQLFWGKAQLDAEEYPNVRLTLTLYTLSLDPKWMKL